MITVLVYSFLISWLLWIFYIAVMALKKVKDGSGLSPAALTLGYPALIVGYLLDMVVNTFVFSVILWELPKETTVTARLKRHKANSTGFRLRVANWFASELLDKFDPSGKHI
jgi:hypothetical protein